MDVLRLPSPARANFADGFGTWLEPSGMISRISDLVHTSRWCRLLNVGCGPGGTAGHLTDLTGCEVIVVDLLLPVLSTSRRQGTGDPTGKDGLKLVAGAAAALPFAPASFDQIWCLGLVAHVPDLMAFGQEMLRVLRPGGVAVLTEAFWDGMRAPRFARTAPAQRQALTSKTLVALLAKSGLEGIEVTPWPRDVAPGEQGVDHPLLREDLADRRLVPHLVTARRPS